MDNELKQYLDGMEVRIGEQIDGRIREAEERIGERIDEKVRDIQTELLRGMAAFTEAITLRMRKIEANNSNLDLALSGRMDILEKRLGEIEQRLGGITH
jgi:hypothetical protein